MAVSDYSTTPGSNGTISGINIAENCPPAGINDAIRQEMADARTAFNDNGWVNYGNGSGTPAYTWVSGTSFSVGTSDLTATYTVGRRVRAVGGTTGTIYGTITSAAFTSVTTVVVAWDSGSMANETLVISLGPDTRSIVNTPLNYYGNGNRLINPYFTVDTINAGASQTITAGAALAYTVDQWYAYCTGANLTGQQIRSGTLTGPEQYAYQFTGAASVTAIGFGQRIEAVNTADMANQNVTLTLRTANSLLTTVNWALYYASSIDTFGTIASPTKTLISSGSFTVTSAMANYSATVSVPSAAVTGLEVVYTVGAQISGTWIIGASQLELGSVFTGWQIRDIATERAKCARYAQWVSFNVNFVATGGAQTFLANATYTVMRAIPTAGTVSIDPNVGSHSISNVASSSMGGLTPYGCAETVVSTAAGSVSVFGYRALLTAVL